ncbi:hypothetical protein DFH06DRAFT_110440 [Mycena polygramma]|nr:hypothetical protein DFH06DRAFT_110440 [Mycena polygramma]
MPLRFKIRWHKNFYVEDMDTEWPVSTFVIYLPKGTPDLPYNAKVTNVLNTFAHTLPSGGTVCSTHYPKEALSWVEAHYNGRLLASIRARGLGGPMATMLFPERQALAIFGSIKEKGVRIAAQTLADASGYAVIIQPRSDDPVLVWDAPPVDLVSFDANPGNDDSTNTDVDAGGSETRDGFRGMAQPNGDEEIDDKFAPWMSPVHRSNIRLQLSPTSTLTHDVTIALETQFTLQTPYAGVYRHGAHGPRPPIVSRTHLKVTSNDLQVLPDRSYGSVMFSTPEDDFYKQEWIDCGFDRPTQTMLCTRLRTYELFFLCLKLYYKSDTKKKVVKHIDENTPKWTLSHKRNIIFSRNYACWSFGYDVDAEKNIRHPMEVVYSVGMCVLRHIDQPADLPTVSFVARNQTMLWVPNAQLRTRGFGIIVMSSSYIPNCQSRIPVLSEHDAVPDLSYGGPSPNPSRSSYLPRIVLQATPLSLSSVMGRWRKKFKFRLLHSGLDQVQPRGWVPEQKRWLPHIYPALRSGPEPCELESAEEY